MSKRKSIVNEIIYELDLDDVDTSSEDERNESKKICAAREDSPIIVNDSLNDTAELEVVDVDSSDDAISILSPAAVAQNGGKSPEVNNSELVVSSQEEDNSDNARIIDVENDPVSNEENIERASVSSLNEDIIVDSPGSNAVVAGCENRRPLVTVMFKNRRLANEYKKKIKEFMLKLIKLHEEDSPIDFENETDLELDIWPEDLIEEQKPEDDDAGLFFVDTEPVAHNSVEIPQYSQNSTMLLNEVVEEPATPTPTRRGPSCFNCDGAHPLKDCALPRNNLRIMENRKAMNANRVGRYHVEDEQKYGHLVPGRISGKLRHAMCLRRDELPPYIYRMRALGYPPGWLEEARISHSGIIMFDCSGKAIQDPEEEDGEVCEPGSKDKFDIKKILDFPGFNVPPSSRYKEEGYKYHVPPLSEQDSKLNMLQVLAPNAMKAYKRKKLAFFPTSSSNNLVLDGQAEMELDSDDDCPAFPSVPPLPDEAPPPPPPPPTAPPPPPPTVPPPPPTPPPCPPTVPPPSTAPSPGPPTVTPPPPTSPPCPPTAPPLPPASPPCPPTAPAPPPTPPKDAASSTMQSNDNDKTQNDDEGICSEGETTQSSAGRVSPTLTDLEEKKRLLLAALDSSPQSSPAALAKTDSDVTQETTDTKSTTETDEAITEPSLPSPIENAQLPIVQNAVAEQEPSSSMSPATPKTGHVKLTSYGTPVINVASPFNKLPTDDKFAKDICDVINFENLPDSTGKYVKISNLLKRVKSEVDRIQES